MTPMPGSNDIVRASHVRLAYRALLGRLPSEEEVVLQLSGVRTTGELLQVLTSAPEFTGTANVLADPPPSAPIPAVVNLWRPELAEWTHPPGTTSEGGDATVGREGWVFLTGGLDAMLDQHTGRFELEHDWDERWTQLLEFRAAEAERLGVQLVNLVIPDKLAVKGQHLDGAPAVAGPRPALRLADAAPGRLLYPLQELLERDRPFLRADTHLTFDGLATVTRAALAALDGSTLTDLPATSESVRAGDLGRKFLPPILEAIDTCRSFGAATLTEDNFQDVVDKGGFIGIRRVLRNETAGDDRTVVVFGESSAFPSQDLHGLCWFLAQHFREVHFIWAPFGWDPAYVEQCGATVVISETVERLLRRVPTQLVDTADLTERATHPGQQAPESLVFAAHS